VVRGVPLGDSRVKSVADRSMIRFLLLTTPLGTRGAATDSRMINSVEGCWNAGVYSNFIELVDAKKDGATLVVERHEPLLFFIVKAIRDRSRVVRFLIATNAFLFAVRLLIPARLTRLKALEIPWCTANLQSESPPPSAPWLATVGGSWSD
jgi:hypothetical protein